MLILCFRSVVTLKTKFLGDLSDLCGQQAVMLLLKALVLNAKDENIFHLA